MNDAYVINLKHRTDRWESMKQNWSDKFNLIRVDGIILPPDQRPHIRVASEGLGRTHMKLLKEAKEQGFKTILILEDDAIPEPNWYERWVEIKTYLDSHLDEWEVFNGGAHFLRHVFNLKQLDQSVLLQGRVACASHFMYLNLDAYDKFMKWSETMDDIDIFYCCLEHKLYCSYPILSKQADGKSDIIEENREWKLTYETNELNFQRHIGALYLKYKPISSNATCL